MNQKWKIVQRKTFHLHISKDTGFQHLIMIKSKGVQKQRYWEFKNTDIETLSTPFQRYIVQVGRQASEYRDWGGYQVIGFGVYLSTICPLQIFYLCTDSVSFVPFRPDWEGVRSMSGSPARPSANSCRIAPSSYGRRTSQAMWREDSGGLFYRPSPPSLIPLSDP